MWTTGASPRTPATASNATKEAAPGVAARYYMNRNYFVADPDAFAVSTQTIADQSWHEERKPASLDEARAAIALAAVTAGMFEIGDNLPTLEHEPDRLALLENHDLIDMVQLGRSSIPIDLMEYREQDQQPTTFFLKESPRQSILTVFNWTKQPVDRTIALDRLGLSAGAQYALSDVLEKKDLPAPDGGQCPAHHPCRIRADGEVHRQPCVPYRTRRFESTRPPTERPARPSISLPSRRAAIPWLPGRGASAMASRPKAGRPPIPGPSPAIIL